MSYNKIEFEIKGVEPLLLHNGALANPLNQFVIEMKKYSGKRKKTESDYQKLAYLEWMGGLYINEDKEIVIPGEVLEAAIVSGARKKRQGKQAEVAIFVENNARLIYDGPTDLEELWEDKRFRLEAIVRIRSARIVRTCPKFKDWSAKFVVTYDKDIVNMRDVVEHVKNAGSQCGIGDWRPKFGRFEIVSYKEL